MFQNLTYIQTGIFGGASRFDWQRRTYQLNRVGAKCLAALFYVGLAEWSAVRFLRDTGSMPGKG
jgi:hypothetical protein